MSRPAGLLHSQKTRDEMSAARKKHWAEPANRAKRLENQLSLAKRCGLMDGAEDDYWMARKHRFPIAESIGFANKARLRLLEAIASARVQPGNHDNLDDIASVDHVAPREGST